jgi:hypothetical protein
MKTIERESRMTISERPLPGIIAAVALAVVATWPTIEVGFLGFRTWLVERLAEWDTWRPGEKDCVPVTEWPEPARSELKATAVPLEVANSVSMASNPPVEAGELLVTAGDAPVEVRLARELCQSVGADGADPSTPGPAARSQSMLAAGVPADDMFEENPDGYEPAEEDPASDASSRPLAMKGGPSDLNHHPVVPDDEWNRWDDDVDMVAESPPRPPVAAAPSGDAELGRAIALTREAARAWMDVLAGPTSVRVTAR